MNVRASMRVIALSGLVAATIALPTTPALAIAAGCTASHPTAIGGDIYGYGGTWNNYSVQVQVGMDLFAGSQKVDIDGNATGALYSYSDWVNNGLGQPGAASGYERTWGEQDSDLYLCIAGNITQASFEVYPKVGATGSQVTDKTYYGEVNDYFNTVTSGATNTYDLRIPTGHVIGETYWGGNTGDINGYATYNGHAIPPSSLVFRVRPNSGGSACGVQGGAMGVDDTGVNNALDATYYDITFLAGGQCGASSQSYKMYVYCNTYCGATQVMKFFSPINIANGARPRIDVSFP